MIHKCTNITSTNFCMLLSDTYHFIYFSIAGPKIANFGFREDLREGMRTAITCIVLEGDEPLTTKWLKDGRPLEEEDLDVMIVYADEGFVSTLTLKNLASRHNGNYTCIAENDVASGTQSAILIVKGEFGLGTVRLAM